MALTVAYTQMGKARKEDSNYLSRTMKLVFGDGVLTYDTGVSIDKRKLGCPNEIVSFNIMGPNNGLVYKYDFAAEVLHIYEVPDATVLAVEGPLVELDAAEAPAAVTMYVEVTGW